MIENIKNSRGNTQLFAGILTDLSKTFEYIRYELLLAKLNVYRFDQEALKLFHSYLCDRSQKAKVGSSVSNGLDILCGVLQGSILGSLLLKIDVCDLFFIDMSSDFANYADTTPYECVLY